MHIQYLHPLPFTASLSCLQLWPVTNKSATTQNMTTEQSPLFYCPIHPSQQLLVANAITFTTEIQDTQHI